MGLKVRGERGEENEVGGEDSGTSSPHTLIPDMAASSVNEAQVSVGGGGLWVWVRVGLKVRGERGEESEVGVGGEDSGTYSPHTLIPDAAANSTNKA